MRRGRLGTWAGGRGWPAGPLLFGGDLNLRRPAVDGMTWLGGNHVDHFFGRGVAGPAFEVLERGRCPTTRRSACGQPLRPNPRSISIARSPAVPGLGSTPRSIAAL